jgi:putative DNA primase/helicase
MNSTKAENVAKLGLQTAPDGRAKDTPENYTKVLNNETFAGSMVFNQLTRQRELLRSLPWWSLDGPVWPFKSVDVEMLREHMQQQYGLPGGKMYLYSLDRHFAKNAYHPVKSFLNRLSWDGVQRLNRLFIDYLGAEDSQYSQEAARKTLTAAVARVMEPGTHFEQILALVGPEASGKSFILSLLAGAWLNTSMYVTSTPPRDRAAVLNRSWIVEVETLAPFSARVAAVLEQCGAAAELNGERRQSVLVCTAINKDFIKKAPNPDRYRIVEVNRDKATKNVFNELTHEYVGQLWAEAVQAYRDGEELHINPKTKYENNHS